MRSLWTRIGLGAFGIFAVGMLVLTLFHNARDSARSALLSFIGAQDVSATMLPEAPAAPVAPATELAAASSRLGVPPPRYTVSGRQAHCRAAISATRASTYSRSSAGETPDAKLQYVHFCAQNG